MPCLPVALQQLPLLTFPAITATAAAAHAHAADTLLPRGFFLALGLIYLAALALDRLAERLRLPGAAAILLLGLALHDLTAGFQHIRPGHVQTAERISLALLIFYAGLGTDLRRIRGSVAAGLRLTGLSGLLTLASLGLLLMLAEAPLLAAGLPSGAAAGLPLAAAWLTACCLTATDSAALEDLLASLGQAIRGRVSHLLQFEAAMSTLAALLCFGFLAGVLQLQPHAEHLALHVEVAETMPLQLLLVGRHLLAGLIAGLLVGALAPPLINRLVRSESQLLLLAIAVAFVAYGLGQALGGGGLLSVFTAGMLLSNGRYPYSHIDQHALHRALHPFNTAAELTVLLLLGLSVAPSRLPGVLPLALLLALALPLARLAAVWLALPAGSFRRPERLTVAACGLRGAVPLGLALTMAEELPGLQGIPEALAESLADQLLALVFLVVLINLLLQSGLMHGLMLRLPHRLRAAGESSPPASEAAD